MAAYLTFAEYKLAKVFFLVLKEGENFRFLSVTMANYCCLREIQEGKVATPYHLVGICYRIGSCFLR